MADLGKERYSNAVFKSRKNWLRKNLSHFFPLFDISKTMDALTLLLCDDVISLHTKNDRQS